MKTKKTTKKTKKVGRTIIATEVKASDARMESSEWTCCEDQRPPEGIDLETKIDDDKGVRNIAILRRRWKRMDTTGFAVKTWRRNEPMCLPIKVRHPEKVLSEGVHAGHEFVTVHNGMGFRCGYVKVEKGHPWYGKDYDDIDCSVHGGLTFAEYDVKCENNNEHDKPNTSESGGHNLHGGTIRRGGVDISGGSPRGENEDRATEQRTNAADSAKQHRRADNQMADTDMADRLHISELQAEEANSQDGVFMEGLRSQGGMGSDCPISISEDQKTAGHAGTGIQETNKAQGGQNRRCGDGCEDGLQGSDYENERSNKTPEKDTGYWVGFDAGHCNDAQDPALPLDNEHTRGIMPVSDLCVVRTQEYVEEECRSLCEQAAAAAINQQIERDTPKDR